MPSAELQREAQRRRSLPAFGLLTRAAAAALASGDIEPFAEGVERARAGEEDVLFLARVHGVSGLLARLADAAPDARGALAEPIRAALSAERARVGARGARLAEDLAALGRRAERAGLPFVPLKGAVLAPERYGDASLRPAADIDLLAPPGTLAAWRRLLAEAGYREAGTTFKHVSFVNDGARVPDGFGEHPENPRPVDLHAELHERLFGRVDDVTAPYLERLREGTLHGVPALLPSDDALLLHLLLHAAPAVAGRGARLVQLQDFALLAPSPDAPRAAAAALGEVAWGTAQLAARALPGCLPSLFLEALGACAPAQARRHAWLARPGLLTGEHESEWLVLAEMPLCATPGDALRRLAAVLPERTLLAERYGAATPYAAALARYALDRLRPSRRA